MTCTLFCFLTCIFSAFDTVQRNHNVFSTPYLVGTISFYFIFYLFDWWLILERDSKRGRNIDLWLVVHSLGNSYMCLTGDQTRNLGTWGCCSNQLSYPARAPSPFSFFLSPFDVSGSLLSISLAVQESQVCNNLLNTWLYNSDDFEKTVGPGGWGRVSGLATLSDYEDLFL